MNLATSNATPQALEIEDFGVQQGTAYGIFVAFCLVSSWAMSLTALLLLNLHQVPVWLIPIATLWQAFLYTGLFITAHDAMHGSVCYQFPKINHFIGALAVSLYGFFPYRELLKKHCLHHRYPASDRDPDFHDGKHTHPVLWYFYFLSRYWSWKQLIGMTIVHQMFNLVLHIPQTNLILFWILPSILSSIQLFYFGTFLTHREPVEGFKNLHRTQTNPLPTFWSLITCYHFGYHEEHHQYPQVSWWQLPLVHRAFDQSSRTGTRLSNQAASIS